jgi:hypothetical protein
LSADVPASEIDRMQYMVLLCIAFGVLASAMGDELSIPGRWPMDMASTLDKKAVVIVGGPAMQGGGKLDLVDVDTFKILKTADLPDHQSASSVVIVPYKASVRGAAVVAMYTQMIGKPDAIYMVSLEDSSFGSTIWTWAPPRDHGDLFTDMNAAVATDASGKYIYLGSGSSKNVDIRRADAYNNRWWLHVLDITGSEPKSVQTVELPSYTAKSYYSGFGVFPSPDGSHVLVNSNMAGVDGSPIALVENAASATHAVRNITTLHKGVPAFVNVLAWDAEGKGFYADYSFFNSDKTDLVDVHIHSDLHGRVIASAEPSALPTRVEHEFYGKGYVTGETVFYPTYSSGTMVQGLVAAFGTAGMADQSSNEHVAVSYWPKAVTVAGGKLWVAWQSMDKATVNRYSLAVDSKSHIIV